MQKEPISRAYQNKQKRKMLIQKRHRNVMAEEDTYVGDYDIPKTTDSEMSKNKTAFALDLQIMHHMITKRMIFKQFLCP